MVKILSFDIGIRNLAYIYLDFIDIDNFSILDWDVIDILDHKHNTENDQKSI